MGESSRPDKQKRQDTITKRQITQLGSWSLDIGSWR